jgi:hypothetical protein
VEFESWILANGTKKRAMKATSFSEAKALISDLAAAVATAIAARGVLCSRCPALLNCDFKYFRMPYAY